jgi:surface polysaccharide O-acyltransferase-like enzyme
MVDNDQQPSKQKEKFDFIDLLKAIASYFVIIYHYNFIDIDFVNQAEPFQYFNYFLTTILTISVPVFFFVNGALLLNKTDLNIRRHTFKILNFVILVIAWGSITHVLLSLIHNKEIILRDLISSIYNLRQGWTNHLWFLEALVVVYIFYPLLFNSFRQGTKYFYFFFGCVTLLTLGNTLLTTMATTISFLFKKFLTRDLAFNYFSSFNAFEGIYGYSIAYFMLGGIMIRYRNYLYSNRIRIVSILAIPVAMFFQFLYGLIASKRQNEIWDSVWHGHDTIFTLMIVVSLFVIFLRYKHQGVFGKVIKLIGENSLGIYFLHVIVAEFISPFIFNNPLRNDFISNSFFALIVLAICLIVTVGLKKVPILKYLVLIK